MLILNSCIAQQINYRFLNLNDQSGLYDKAVYQFDQDNLGFIWMGTASGLKRFDGTNFISFKSDKDDSYKQVSTILDKMVYDKKRNRLWLKSISDIQYFDLNTYQFHRLPPSDLLNTIPLKQINDLSIIGQDLLWVTCQTELFQFDIKTEKWSTIPLFENTDNTINKTLIKPIQINDKNVVILTRNTLISYNLALKTFTFKPLKQDYSFLDACLDIEGKIIWAVDGNSIIGLDLRTNEVLKKQIPINKIAKKIIPFDKDRLWLSNATLFNTKTKSMEHIVYDDGIYDDQLLYVSELFKDKQGNLWRGSYESGASILPFQNYEVRTYELKTKEKFGVETLKAIKLKNKPTVLVVGNPLSGVLKLDIQSGQIEYITNGLIPMSYIGYDLIESSNGHVVMTDGNNLYKVDIVANKLTPFISSVAKHLKNVTTICAYDTNKLILSSKDHIIFLSNEKEVDIVPYATIDTTRSKFDNYYFRPALVAKDKSIYYVAPSGIYKQKNIKSPINKFELPIANSGKVITSPDRIVEDKNGNIWISSLINGLFKYDVKNKKLHNYNSKNSAILSDYIQSLALEQGNVIIAGSTSQLYRFDAESGNYLSSITKQNGFSRDDSGYDFSISEDRWFIRNNYASIDISDLAKQGSNPYSPQPIFTSIQIGGKENLKVPTINPISYKVKSDDDQISISFASPNYSNHNKNRYRYRLIGLDTTWFETNTSSVEYARLAPGKFKFEVIGINNDGIRSLKSSQLEFTIMKPFYSTFWFIGGVFLFFSGIAYTFYKQRILSLESKEKLKRAYDKQLSELEMKALRAQMNPHFIFNSLNSIQKFIFEKDEFAASQYLTKFSRLIRLILNQSNQEYITIESEIELTKLYIELESLRFDNSFHFSLEVDANINQLWMLPSMIVQPHLENAIWHGLLHEPNNGHLYLKIKSLNSTQFQIIIEDNGIGRTKAALLKSKQLLKEKSFGSTISKDRLTHLNHIYPNSTNIAIEDLYNDKQQPKGTRIVITLPIITNSL